MKFEHAATFEHPVEDVFAWHARPGALTRLLPPWQPVRVAKESDSLRDGEAELVLPGHLRWRARHVPEGYDSGRRFTDVLATPGLAQLIGWRHTHVFEAEDRGRSRLVDRVEARVPARMLERMFAYRARQMAGDLDAHGRWRRDDGRPLTVAVTGSSGLIGTALGALLSSGGHQVVRLVRAHPSASERLWRPDEPGAGLLEGVDAVVHLAGATIAGPFSSDHKRAVRDSRVGPTRRLADAAARAGVGVFVSASAVGFYGPDRRDDELTEASGRGDGFLAELVADWESAAQAAGADGARVVFIRTGLVLSPRGGVLRLFKWLFQAGLGGRLGDGRSWMPWIGIDDMADIYLRALVDPTLSGPVNATAPEPVRNAEFTRLLAQVLRRPAAFPVPRLGPRLLLGREGAEEMAFASQRVRPAVLMGGGHRFRHPDLEPALRHVLGRSRQSEPV